MTRTPSRRALLAGGAAAGASALLGPAPAHAAPVELPLPDLPAIPEPPKAPVAAGAEGAVATVDAYASEVGIRVLQAGGNAVDAAIAVAATLGVTEPFSCGIGGGGFMLVHEASTGRTHTIDGRETAPAAFTPTTFTDGSGQALDVDRVVSSGLSVGVPGTVALWETAARRFGTMPLGDLLAPAEAIARAGFVVDANFADHVAQNAQRFAMFPATARLYLPGGRPPEVGSTQRNPDLADTYGLLATQGPEEMYRGSLARAVVAQARRPETTAGTRVYAGLMTEADLAGYRTREQAPTRSTFHGLEVRGMGPSSSGGIAVGEILNLMAAYELRYRTKISALSEVDYLHWFSEACATAFADRNRWVGDVPGVPVAELLSTGFAAERARLLDPARARSRPVPFGSPDGDYGDDPAAGVQQGQPTQGRSTTHFNVADRWGNVVACTFTIEQTGGSGIVVPGHGFLLNNELTDFDFVPLQEGVPDPNLPGPGKRPRSSMSPTIVLQDGRPRMAVGTPGGSTIITTVAQIVLGHLARGLPLVEAIAAPRLSSRNGTRETTDLGLDTGPTGAALTAKGHALGAQRWIGNASALAVEDGRMVAAAETVRGGGGAARVVRPVR